MRRAQINNSGPSSARARAKAAPKPELAPVITIDFRMAILIPSASSFDSDVRRQTDSNDLEQIILRGLVRNYIGITRARYV
jgi:hypothetical protein